MKSAIDMELFMIGVLNESHPTRLHHIRQPRQFKRQLQSVGKEIIPGRGSENIFVVF